MSSVIATSVLVAVMACSISYFVVEHANRRLDELINEVDHRAYRLLDEANERARQLISETLIQLNQRATEQMDKARQHADSIRKEATKDMPLQNPYGATTCTDWFGCHKGYCWAGCAGAFPVVTGPEWCYTMKSSGKVTCSQDSDCDGCWRCTSPCSV